MRKHTYHLCLLTAVLVMFAACCTTLCQRDTALRSLDHCKAEVERQEIVLDQWETFYQFRDEIDKMWDERVAKLNDNIRGYKALNGALEGRIRKMAGVFHIREQNLLDDIKYLGDELLKCRTNISPGSPDPPNQEHIESAPIPGCR